MIKILFLILCIVGCSQLPKTGNEALAPSPGEAQELSSQATLLLKEAKNAYSKIDYLKTLQNLETLEAISPNAFSAKDRSIQVYSYLAIGSYEKALKAAEQLVKLSPHDPIPYQQLGLAYFWLKKMDLALDSFGKGLEFDSHPPKLHFYIGLVYESKKNQKEKEVSFAKAEEEYAMILKKNPKDFSANFELAYLRLYWNKEVTSVPTLIKTARASLGDPDPELISGKRLYLDFYLSLLTGISLIHEKELVPAEKALMKALENVPVGAKPDLAEVLFYLSEVKLAQGDTEGQKHWVSLLKKTDPTGPFAAKVK